MTSCELPWRAGALTLLAAAGLASAAAAAAATTDGTRPEPRSAQQLYQTVCARCHDTRLGPVLLGRALHPQATEAIVRAGRAAMPAFRESEISTAELAALVTFVNSAPAPGGTR